MDDVVERNLTGAFYLSLAIITIYIAVRNLHDPWGVIALSGLLVISITIRNAVFHGSPRLYKIGKATVIINIILVFFMMKVDGSSSANLFYYVLIGDSIFAYSYKFSIGMGIICFLSYISERYISNSYVSFPDFLSLMATQALAFVFITAAMFILKYEMKQRNKLKETMYELKVKSKQMENIYFKLKKTSEELEEMTILKERNRIAREIHDTVGHTLTTVLVELEAGERLLREDPDMALEKLGLAKGQVRRGLNDIRTSVRMLQSGKEIMDFTSSLKLLIEDTIKHGGVFIKFNIPNLPKLTESQENTIYRALQEGLTNGIKHGKSTAFVFRLDFENGFIKFLLQDNGSGSDNVVQGFGLTAMEERVKELGGIFSISSGINEGFSIRINLPVGEVAV